MDLAGGARMLSPCGRYIGPGTTNDLRRVADALSLFSRDDEEYRVLPPFIREGFHRGGTVIHVVNPDRRDDHLWSAPLMRTNTWLFPFDAV